MNLEFPRINLEFLEIAPSFFKASQWRRFDEIAPSALLPRNDAENFRIPRDYFARNDKKF